MDFFLGEDEDGDVVYKDERILSTDLKKAAGFDSPDYEEQSDRKSVV